MALLDLLGLACRASTSGDQPSEGMHLGDYTVHISTVRKKNAAIYHQASSSTQPQSSQISSRKLPYSRLDNTSEDSSSSDDEIDDEGQLSVSPRTCSVSGHGRAGCASRGRGRGKNLNSGHLAPSTTVVIPGWRLTLNPIPAVPQAAAPAARCAAVPSRPQSSA